MGGVSLALQLFQNGRKPNATSRAAGFSEAAVIKSTTVAQHQPNCPGKCSRRRHTPTEVHRNAASHVPQRRHRIPRWVDCGFEFERRCNYINVLGVVAALVCTFGGRRTLGSNSITLLS